MQAAQTCASSFGARRWGPGKMQQQVPTSPSHIQLSSLPFLSEESRESRCLI